MAINKNATLTGYIVGKSVFNQDNKTSFYVYLLSTDEKKRKIGENDFLDVIPTLVRIKVSKDEYDQAELDVLNLQETKIDTTIGEFNGKEFYTSVHYK